MTGTWKGKKIAVLMGGESKERDISLRTGNAVTEGLRRRGYDVMPIDVVNGEQLVTALLQQKPDAAVIALHGKIGEDGCVQGLLEVLRIPYTGGGVLASSVGMDKVVCKQLARELHIPVPRDWTFCAETNNPDTFAVDAAVAFPVIVKPAREGSTINMTIVQRAAELPEAIRTALKSDGKIVIEQFVKGREVTVGVLNGEALPVLEIAPKSGFYDYASKYTKGMTEYIVPARIGAEIAEKLQLWSERLYRQIECDGTARADFIVVSDAEAVFLEINTIPGMTATSLLPKAASAIGIDFKNLCLNLVRLAYEPEN